MPQLGRAQFAHIYQGIRLVGNLLGQDRSGRAAGLGRDHRARAAPAPLGSVNTCPREPAYGLIISAAGRHCTRLEALILGWNEWKHVDGDTKILPVTQVWSTS